MISSKHYSPRERCRALETWRLVDREYRDNPSMNLAVEEAIPRMVGEGKAPSTVRFWHNSNTIVIGCFQSAKLEVNLQAVFQRLSEGAVEGLRTLGVKAAFQPVNDIQVDGKKVSGAAGSIRWNSVFHHGCILVNSDLSILGKVLNVPRVKLEDRHVASVQKRVTTVRDELGRDISTREVRNSIVDGIESCYEVRVESSVLMKEEVGLAEELYQTKYSRLEWNLEP